MADDTDVLEPKNINAVDLDDRQIRGVQLAQAADCANGNVITPNDSTSIWMSKRGNRAWTVTREVRNRRGKTDVEYACSCGDYQKNGRVDCLHIFAERIRRGEIVIVGKIARRRAESANAGRQPARQRLTPVGRPMRSIQRDARVALADRIQELLRDLARAMERE